MFRSRDHLRRGSDDGDSEEPTTGSGAKSVKVSISNLLQSFRSGSAFNKATKLRPQQKMSGVSPRAARTNKESLSIVVQEPEQDGGAPEEEIEEYNSDEEVTSCSSLEISQPLMLDRNLEESVESRQPSTANVIRPIDRNVVHQICSGQVIVTLSTAVKELVENSLDAGATKIDIRLVEFGSSLVEVADNGSGIDESNFKGLALKHHTSKISEFQDLETLTTFGFRGEALSSLCALSNLTVITRYSGSSQKIGYKIEYENSGKLSCQTRTAREFGTTVVLKNLFHTLPVRHKEFLKNIKKEFNRLVNILYGYCLVVNEVRISCTNQTGNAGPATVVSVPASKSMKERIVAVFGSKQLSSLIEIKKCDEVPEEILAEYGLTGESYENKYELEGYISLPNKGRSSNDRQFFFINSRPCDAAKISRTINEVYRSFSRHQNPFVCLHIKTRRENVDVNVTPDKRTLYVQNEKILLATLKATLVPLFTSAASSYIPVSSQLTQLTLGNQSSQFRDSSLCLNSSQLEQITNDNSFENDVVKFASQRSSQIVTQRVDTRGRSYSNRDTPREFSGRQSGFASNKRSRDVGSCQSENPKRSRLDKFQAKKQNIFGRNACESESSGEIDSGTDTEISLADSEDNANPCGNLQEDGGEISQDDDVVVLYDDDSELDDNGGREMAGKKCTMVSIDWKDIGTKLREANDKTVADARISSNYARRFRAKISPEDNCNAEEELKKQLSKDMFCQMQILGQFNLGFIIVRSGPDLFIVDQHASDEKFNFEDLEKNMLLQGQPLIHPLDLQLPAVSENIIIDNLGVFQKNGFDFIISPEEEPTKRVKLSRIPYSKNTEFGKADIEELIFMMEDASSECFYRPTKVRDMLASRACRKSVMIGTALNSKEMRSVVDHMGLMNQPWNCPHGRPTIRHLISLNLLPDMDYTKFNH